VTSARRRWPRQMGREATSGLDLRQLPLTERQRRLGYILPKGSPIISEALSVSGTGRQLFELMCANDLEGIVAKRLTDSYNPRTRWLKIKTRATRRMKAGANCSTNHLDGLRGTFACPTSEGDRMTAVRTARDLRRGKL